MNLFSSERLSFRHVQTSDAEFVHSLLNSEGWLQYIGDRGVHDLKDAVHYITSNIQVPYGPKGFGLHGISVTGSEELIGLCGLLQRDFLEYPDLGFAILPEYEGKGYIKEASLTILSVARLEHQLSQVMAFTSLDNDRSIGLLIKIGFTLQEVFQLEGAPLNLYISNL